MSRKVIDLTGRKFGKLKIIERVGSDKKGNATWLCLCDCGNKKITTTGRLNRGQPKSCGCSAKEHLWKNSITHGMSYTKLYETWRNMLARCRNKKNKRYKDYGGRGITICEEWLEFKNFYNDMGKKPDGMSIDRIDNNKGYFPENCRWVKAITQQNNMRSNHIIKYKGQYLSVAQWAKKLGINQSTLSKRLFRSNWPIKKALS